VVSRVAAAAGRYFCSGHKSRWPRDRCRVPMTLWLVKAKPRNVTGAALPRDEGSDGRPAGLATRTMEGVGEGTYNSWHWLRVRRRPRV
jgi:hypothetical protein